MEKDEKNTAPANPQHKKLPWRAPLLTTLQIRGTRGGPDANGPEGTKNYRSFEAGSKGPSGPS